MSRPVLTEMTGRSKMEERGEEKSIFFSYVYEHRYTVAWALGCAVCFAAVFLLRVG